MSSLLAQNAKIALVLRSLIIMLVLVIVQLEPIKHLTILASIAVQIDNIMEQTASQSAQSANT